MIQVRLSDAELVQFEKIKSKLKLKSNADTLRRMIQSATRNSGQSLTQMEQLHKSAEDLEAKVDALLWNDSNITKNLNEIAHAANIAKDNDPANTETWNWIIQQLQQIFPSIEELDQVSNKVKKFLKRGHDKSGDA